MKQRRTRDREPLRRPDLGWFGGVITGLRRARDSLDAHLRVAPVSTTTWRVRVDQWFTVVADAIASHWDEFAHLAGDSGAEIQALRRRGLPQFEFDPEQELPVMTWARASAEEEGSGWPTIQVAARPPFHIRVPFRPVVLSRLPADTALFAIEQPRHAALACAVASWQMLVDDVDAAFSDVGDDVGWLRVRALMKHYARAVRVALATVSPDQFRDWAARLPRVTTLRTDAVPDLIASIATGVAAQRLVAIHLAQALFRSLVAEAESESSVVAYRKARLKRALTETLAQGRTALDRANADRLAAASAPRRGVDVELVLRPLPAGLPVLALIPRRRRAVVVAHPTRR